MFGFNFFKNRSYLRKSKDCFDDKDYDSALEFVNLVLDNDYKNLDALIYKVNCLLKLGSVDEDISVCKDLLVFYPENPSVYLLYANVLENYKEDYSAALKLCDDALDIFPDNVLALWGKYGILSKTGRDDEASLINDRILEINPNQFEILCNKSSELMDKNDYLQALSFLNRAILINPNVDKVWFNKGFALYNMNRFDDALLSYDKALKLDSSFPDTWFNKALIYHECGDFKKAISLYDEALAIDSLYYGALYNKSLCFIKLEDYYSALKVINQTLDIEKTVEALEVKKFLEKKIK